MSAFQSKMDEKGVAPRDIRVAVVADRPALRARIALLLDQAACSRPTIIYRGGLAAFFARGGASCVDVAVIAVEEEPGETVAAQINALTRSTGVALVGDPWMVRKLMVADGMRARICLSRDDLTPNSLEAALTGLLRARASEDRLLQIVAGQSGRMLQMRSIGARLAHEVDAVVQTFNAFAQQTTDLAMDGATRRAMALAMDAVEGLESARGEFDRSLRGGQQALFGPADLNTAIEAFVENLSGAGARKVSALTSSSPIFVQADGASVRRLLDCILQSWRETRRPTDRLELLSWDAGAEAKLAIVFSRTADDFSAVHATDDAPAPASEFLTRLLRDMKPHADVCGARIAVDSGACAATLLYLMLSLPKKPGAPAYPLACGAPAFPEAAAAAL
jgi:hypothetical protein